jgi:aminoglycoside phosphotransferase (APT) family kinase protein
MRRASTFLATYSIRADTTRASTGFVDPTDANTLRASTFLTAHSTDAVLVAFAPIEALALALTGPPAWLLVVDEAPTLEHVRRIAGARGVVVCTATPAQLARIDPRALPAFDLVVHTADRAPPVAAHITSVVAPTPAPPERPWHTAPAPADAGWRPIGQGGDYLTYRRGDEVLRVARHPTLLHALRREQTLLAWLAPQLPFAVPKILAIDGGDTHLFARTSLLTGRPLTQPTIPNDLADDLAAFLAALHAAPLAAAPPTVTALRRLDTTPTRAWARLRARIARYLLHRGHDRLAALLADLPPRTLAALERWLATPPADGPTALVYVHGDLVTNFLVEDGRLSGVLDWGDSTVGDPARDLGSLAALGGAATLERLLARLPADRRRVEHYWRLELVDIVCDLASVGRPLAPWLPRLQEAFDA